MIAIVTPTGNILLKAENGGEHIVLDKLKSLKVLVHRDTYKVGYSDGSYDYLLKVYLEPKKEIVE